MREVKYQAWLHDSKQMILHVPEIDLFHKVIRYYDISHCKDDAEAFGFIRENPPNADCPFECCDLRQYTGLCDRNGREIYEGDILSWEEHVILYGTDLNEWVTEKCPVKYDETLCTFLCAEQFLFNYTEKAEVIGNIYENPELLEVKKDG